jgi:hypothetical protein
MHARTREQATTSIFPLCQRILLFSSFLGSPASFEVYNAFPLPLLGQGTHPISFSRHLVPVLQDLLVLLVLAESDLSQTLVCAPAASLP